MPPSPTPTSASVPSALPTAIQAAPPTPPPQAEAPHPPPPPLLLRLSTVNAVELATTAQLNALLD
ncbi:hypothetical protein BDN72DRAFT_903392 [Pluteus cervinus]|uniref:Uncharacterized protein n=1 Tax=Pluteus cervinus TaxID=181527 RepID=A0ACD3ABL1_9AGAR|nr:hypothetical protein BDN72DRAFT_903392 [Pluteus cervinus]